MCVLCRPKVFARENYMLNRPQSSHVDVDREDIYIPIAKIVFRSQVVGWTHTLTRRYTPHIRWIVYMLFGKLYTFVVFFLCLMFAVELRIRVWGSALLNDHHHVTHTHVPSLVRDVRCVCAHRWVWEEEWEGVRAVWSDGLTICVWFIC